MSDGWYRRTHDLGSIGRMVESLADAANVLDGVGEDMPTAVRAGPFAEEVSDLVKGVAVSAAIESVRMRLLAAAMLDALQKYSEGRASNLAAIDAIATDLDHLQRD